MTGPSPKFLPVPPGDRYVDFKPAGQGGMGVVYWALDTTLNREVAFKVVRPEAQGGVPSGPTELTAPDAGTPSSKVFEELTKRFLEEAWVTGGLSHPGIVPVYELGQTPQGVPYYTMRYVRGDRTLAAAIQQLAGRPFEERIQLLEPFLKICDTIAYAHAKGVVHRDLKPANVALGEFGEVVVLDWGLARLKQEEPDAGETWQRRIQEHREVTDLKTIASVGTPGYMAPEALLGTADERGDVYALGAMLYEILAGRPPHRFESVVEFVRTVRTSAEPARSVDPNVPAMLSEICEKALAVEPGARTGSAKALADGVRAWQAQSAVDREIESLLRDAEGAMQAAEEASGEPRLRHADRAAAALAQVASKRPDSQRARALAERTAGLREQGIRERERASTRKLLMRGGFAVLALGVVAALVVAAVFNAEREEKSRALDEVLRLSDAKRVRDLIAEADGLWPIHSRVAPRMGDWLVRARAVVGKRADHEAALARIEARRVPFTAAEQQRERGGDPARLAEVVRRLDEIRQKGTASDEAGGSTAEAEARALEAERRELEFVSRGRLTPEDAWLRQVLLDLLRGLDTLAGGQIAAVEARAAAAAAQRRTSLEEHAADWTRTIAGIAASPRYAGLVLEPQEGLVPLGPDPASGLYEFAHLGSGSLPHRNDDGHLVYAKDAAIVLVLIPGGTALLGAQSRDRAGANYDPAAGANEGPVRRVTLSPYFLGKHEVTQAEWAALTSGGQPSFFKAGAVAPDGRPLSPRHPVEQISWEDADLRLSRHGLVIPTEAQWEYACRAGTDTPWHVGREVSSLGKAANIADAYLKAGSGGSSQFRFTESVFDGHAIHAPVGSFGPNAFGLYDVHGNVAEWCRDASVDYLPSDPATDPLVTEGSGSNRVVRGGAWNMPAPEARSSFRARFDPVIRGSALGIRAARPVTSD